MSGSTVSKAGDRRFSNVLLICGPSGAGKSTFIKSMAKGELAPELMSLIPKEAARWPTFSENDVRKRRPVAPRVAASPADRDAGVIFHYDTFLVHRIGAPDYDSDPVASHLLETANLTIVNIKPTPGQLRAQYDARLRSHFVRRGYFQSLWRQTVQWQFKRLRYRLLGIGKPYSRDLYDQPGTIDECYRSWEMFLANLLRSRQSTKLVEIVPAASDSGDKRFELLRAS